LSFARAIAPSPVWLRPRASGWPEINPRRRIAPNLSCFNAGCAREPLPRAVKERVGPLIAVAGGLSSPGLLAAVGEFGAEWGLPVEDGVAVAPAGDQLCVMEDGEVFGHGAGGKFVPPGQRVGGGWFGK